MSTHNSAVRTLEQAPFVLNPLSKKNWRNNGAIDFILMALSVVEIAAPGLPVAVPFGELALIMLIAISIFRPRITKLVNGAAWLLGVFALVFFLVLESTVNEVDWFRRLSRIIILFVFFYCVATGRVNLNLALKGYLTGIAVNIPLFYTGLAPDNYGGALTGFLSDKNVAGLVYGISTYLAMLLIRGRFAKTVVFVLGFATVFATGSRTTMAAMLLALAWFLFSRKLNLPFKLLFFSLLLAVFYYVEERFAQIGIFEDRAGSDILRERIGVASVQKVDIAPWYGHGLGEAFVNIEDRSWLFHDSYLGLRAEGGWIFLLAILTAYTAAFSMLLGRSRFNEQAAIAVTSMIVLLFCALKLGEVFLTPVGFFLMGICAFLSSTMQGRTHKNGKTIRTANANKGV